MWSEFQEYLTYLEVDKAVADRTLQSRRRSLEDFTDFCEENGVNDVSDVSRRTISKYIDYLVEEGFAYSTIMQERFLSVGAALRYLYREKLMDESVMERVDKDAIKKKAKDAMSMEDKKKREGPPPHLSKEEVYELADNVGPPKDRNSLLIKLMFWCGLRASDAQMIEVDDINFEKPKIEFYSPKKDSPNRSGMHTVSYPASEINPELRDWIHNGRFRYKAAEESNRLFIGPKGPITTHRINEIVREAAEAAGLQEEARETKAGQSRSQVTSHLLRHSHAMHYLNEENKELEVISKHLGHSSVSVTEEHYAESTDETVVREFS